MLVFTLWQSLSTSFYSMKSQNEIVGDEFKDYKSLFCSLAHQITKHLGLVKLRDRGWDIQDHGIP